MPRRAPIRLFILAFAILSQACNSQEFVVDVEEVERMWMSAIANGDRAVYDRLLTEDFTWTFVSGRVIGREQMMEAIGPVEITETDKSIRVYEDSAVVVGTASLEVQGRPLTERFVRVWVMGQDGQWRLALFQATEIN
jgi:ketosteroid isomerase-like protein